MFTSWINAVYALLWPTQPEEAHVTGRTIIAPRFEEITESDTREEVMRKTANTLAILARPMMEAI
jgi:hypothetical protein